MRTVRICQMDAPLAEKYESVLNEDGFGHLIRVLRFRENDSFVVFDGCGNEFNALLTKVEKNSASFICTDRISRNVESPLKIELGQVISRGDKMDFTIQKACELGIAAITPLYSSRCGVKLDDKRGAKKVEQWQKIAISACEQSGRNTVPKVSAITPLGQWYHSGSDTLSLTLDPKATVRLHEIEPKENLRLLIGPEGGLDATEIEDARKAGFTGVSLGPRILRTETAALAALSILGSRFGDL